MIHNRFLKTLLQSTVYPCSCSTRRNQGLIHRLLKSMRGFPTASLGLNMIPKSWAQFNWEKCLIHGSLGYWSPNYCPVKKGGIAGELLGVTPPPGIADVQFCRFILFCSSQEFKGLKPHFPLPQSWTDTYRLDWRVIQWCSVKHFAKWVICA